MFNNFNTPEQGIGFNFKTLTGEEIGVIYQKAILYFFQKAFISMKISETIKAISDFWMVLAKVCSIFAEERSLRSAESRKGDYQDKVWLHSKHYFGESAWIERERSYNFF